MKKSFKPFIILITLISACFTLGNAGLIHVAKATYVEGPITQDTVWTLVDSPFVVSKNVTVYPSVTLTIEPRVEIRFGGDFSLIVEGTLAANGERDKTIRFTSNKDQPIAGDWGSIIIQGTTASELSNCVIEYGSSALTIENGTANIRNNVIRMNSENGIKISNGIAQVTDNEIVNNTGSGIYVTGVNTVSVENNIIESNVAGINVGGNFTSGVNIRLNNVLNNTDGILFNADAHSNVDILNNTFSRNSYGFHVSTSAITRFTRNYVLDNQIGVFYEQGFDHEAYFNNICGNDIGMTVSTNASVKATRNYWGDRTGPKHESLNPHGKGDQVDGDGVNLDFIFFLTLPIDHENQSPTAIVWPDKVLVAPNQNVTFIGTDSYDEGQVDEYIFNFGDEIDTGWTTLSLFTYKYSETGIHNIGLRVRDDFGQESSETFTVIDVQDLPPLEVSLTLSNYSIACNKEVNATVHVSNGMGSIENADVTLFFVLKGERLDPILGSTNSAGDFTATFTAPDISEMKHIRIIARASAPNYVDGSDFKYLQVLPPLIVNVAIDPPTVRSEETTTLTINVVNSLGEPVSEATLNIVLSFDNGTFLTQFSDATGPDGKVTLNFNVPQTLSNTTIVVAVTAEKADHATGLGQGTITVVPRTLTVQVVASPSTIVSEASSTIISHITSDSTAVENVMVTASSDVGGNFSQITSVTDPDGSATFVFSAPRTTTLEGTNATITVSASMSGYVNGEGHATIIVKPKILSVQIATESTSAYSEMAVNITAQVQYEDEPVQGANVTIMTSEATLANGLTEADGNVSLAFKVPQVNDSANITFTIVAQKDGYVDGTTPLVIEVNPKTFNLQAATPSAKSGELVTIAVQATCVEDSSPVNGANVTISFGDGNLMTNMTDVSGSCTFSFDAPTTTEDSSVTITINAAKSGYTSAVTEKTMMIIAPEAQDWSLVLILILAIVAVVAAVIAVLVKLKIVAISFGDKE